ncbi:MAG: MBL fold hydrolase [Planctomycetaceae bacterium]|nr:MAG: MBL fold hydrolase [Planctomycetaceae bacterium]
MFFKQYYLNCLAHASYLIADETSKQAAVVDPQRDVDHYLADAQEHGFQIRYVILTHFHADFLAGHIELRNRAGARIVLGAQAQAEFDFLKAHEGDVLELGPQVFLKILETPGHTPEGISILVFDRAHSTDQPWAVLTGDTLFVGDVGRPDLLASIGVTADELAQMLYASVQKLRALPDETWVYPAHGAGSLCGKKLSQETKSTIGEQKKYNYALQPMSREDFIKLVTEDQPEAPQYFAYDAMRNRQERPDLEATLQQTLRALTLDELLRWQNQGAQIVDVRDGAEFDTGHLVGSLNIGLRGQYATWCGTLLSKEKPIIVIANPGDEQEAIVRLGRIGFDHVLGYLQDGLRALEFRPDLLESIPRLTAVELEEQLSREAAPLVVDVRTAKEWQAGHIPHSVNIPLHQLRQRLSEVPSDRPVVVHCEGGYRSAIGCSLLAQAGRRNISDLVGGFKAWNAHRQQTVTTA